MKNATANDTFKGSVILLLLFFYSTVFTQSLQNRTITDSFSGISVASIVHQRGPLTVLASKDGKFSFEAVMSMKAKDPENARILFDQFEVNVTENGKELRLETETGIKNWKTVNGKTTITLKNGTKLKDIKDVKIEMRVYVPTSEKLRLQNKYEDINIQDDLNTTLEVQLYSAVLQTKNINGDLILDMKYSKGKTGNFKNGQLSIYDCDLEFGNGETVKLTSKYSNLSFGDATGAELNTYDDELKFGNLSGTLSLTDKYSDFRFGNIPPARMDIYDTDLVAAAGKDLQIKSKYSSLDIESLEDLEFELSYDDEIKVDHLVRLSATSKYTNFSFITVAETLTLNSYDDEITIGSMSKQLKKISLEGKYTKLTLGLEGNPAFRIEANTQYGQLTYPEGQLEPQLYKQVNDKLELRGQTSNATEESPLITINCYDCKVQIK